MKYQARFILINIKVAILTIDFFQSHHFLYSIFMKRFTIKASFKHHYI